MLERKIEYKTLKCSLHVSNMETKINTLATEGWKLITSSVAQDGPFLIFSRPLEIKPDRIQAILDTVQGDNHGQRILSPNQK